MNRRLLSLVIATACTAAFSFARGTGTDADAAWSEVESAMNSVKMPATQPKSQEEAIEYLKIGLTATDKAGKMFLEKYPTDPRRWELKLFDGMTAGARKALGLAEKEDMKTTLAEILKSTDADTETKSEASAITVLESEKEVEEGTLTPAEWTRNADAHLNAYPACKFNTMIAGNISNMKTLAELMNKPLDLKFTAVDGREVDLSKMKGKVVLIDFWATWCGPCVQELPNVLKSYEKFHDKGFEIIGISLDSDKDKLESFTKENRINWPQYFDSKGWENSIATKFGIHSIPAMWLVDKEGKLASTHARSALETDVERLLAK